MAFGTLRDTVIVSAQGSSTSLTFTPVVAPNAGDLWTVRVRVNVSVTATASAGWVKDGDQSPTDTSQNLRIFSRVCDGTEGTSVQTYGTLSTAATSDYVVVLYEGGFAVQASVLDLSPNTETWAEASGTTINTPTGSRTTAGTTAQADELAIAANGANTRSGPTYDGTWGNNRATASTRMICQDKVLTATGTVSWAVSWLTSRSSRTMIATYKKATSSSQNVVPAGQAYAEASGALNLGMTLSPAGQAYPETSGAPNLGMTLSPAGQAYAEVSGAPSLGMTLSPAGYDAPLSVGLQTLVQNIGQASAAFAAGFGGLDIVPRYDLSSAGVAFAVQSGGPDIVPRYDLGSAGVAFPIQSGGPDVVPWYDLGSAGIAFPVGFGGLDLRSYFDLPLAALPLVAGYGLPVLGGYLIFSTSGIAAGVVAGLPTLVVGGVTVLLNSVALLAQAGVISILEELDLLLAGLTLDLETGLLVVGDIEMSPMRIQVVPDRHRGQTVGYRRGVLVVPASSREQVVT